MHEKFRSISVLVGLTFFLPTLSLRAQPLQDPYTTGQFDGAPGGDREGRERGSLGGQSDGRNEGYNAGYNRCEAVEREAAYRRGYDSGSWRGRADGEPRGRQDGMTRGRADGNTQGYAEGSRRADSAAEQSSAGPGTAQGQSQAEASDAREKGRTVGLANGDRDANLKAKSVEVERGRKDYRAERYNEASNQIEFAQKAGFSEEKLLTETNSLSQNLTVVQPDYRYRVFLRTYPTPAENTAYANGVTVGYTNSFHNIYGTIYRIAYNDHYRLGDSEGCQTARNQSHAADEQRGYDEGYRIAFKLAYDSHYQTEYRLAYDREFPSASQRGYQENYDRFYREHFESARAAAYRRHYDELYNQTYRAAYRQKYDQMYPVYAAQYYKQGRSEEEAEFKRIPLRITGITVTERARDGVFRLGEVLRVKFIVRNFAGGPIAASSVKIQIDANDTDTLVLKPWENLAKGLPLKTVAIVTEALGFQVNNGATGDHNLRFSLLKDGVVMEQRTLSFHVVP